MWHRPRPVRILILAVNLITAACGGGGPAAPSVEAPVGPETRSFSGQWRGTYYNGSLDVMSRCQGQGTPLDFYNPTAQSEMTVDIGPSLEGSIHIARRNEALTCPFTGQVDSPNRLTATVNAERCTPPNAHVPAQGYVAVISVTPPGCRSSPPRPEPWVELRTFDISASIDSSSRDYPILVFNMNETGHFHDPRGNNYYTGTYTAESFAMLTHPEDPRVE